MRAFRAASPAMGAHWNGVKGLGTRELTPMVMRMNCFLRPPGSSERMATTSCSSSASSA